MIPNDPLFTVHVREPQEDVCAFLAVHSTFAEVACGGVRAAEDVTLAEVQQLARAMTYKYSFWERPTGGAKAGVVLANGLSPDQRRQVFAAVGRHLSPVLRSGLYQPWPDMNCGPEDVRAMYAAAGLDVGVMPDTSYYTALTIFGAAKATAEFLGLKPEACRLSIEGMGRVGTHLAREIDLWGGRIVAVSTVRGTVANAEGLDVQALASSREGHADSFVEEPGDWERLRVKDLFAVPTDVLVPCARVNSISAGVANAIDARAIVPGANAPCTDGAETALARRGLLVLPDFVCNAGGVMGTRLAQLGVTDHRLRELIVDDLGRMVRQGMALSARQGISPAALARQVAEERYAGRVSKAHMPASLWAAVRRRLARRVPRAYHARQACQEFLRVTRSSFGDKAA